MTSGQNSVMFKIGSGGAEGQKFRKLFVYEPIDRQSKVVSAFQINYEGKYGGGRILIFDIEKELC